MSSHQDTGAAALKGLQALQQSRRRAKTLGRPRLCVARQQGRALASRVLREARRAAGLSRAQVGRRLGVSETMVRQWEDDTSRDAIALGDVIASSPSMAREVARLLGEEARKGPGVGLAPGEHLALVLAELGDVARVVSLSELSVLERELAEVAAAVEAMQRDVRAMRENA